MANCVNNHNNVYVDAGIGVRIFLNRIYVCMLYDVTCKTDKKYSMQMTTVIYSVLWQIVDWDKR